VRSLVYGTDTTLDDADSSAAATAAAAAAVAQRSSSSSHSTAVTELLLQAHAALMDARLAPTVTRHFPKAWCHAATVWVLEALKGDPRWHALPLPAPALLPVVLQQFDPDPDSGIWLLHSTATTAANNTANANSTTAGAAAGAIVVASSKPTSPRTATAAAAAGTAAAAGQQQWVPTVAEPAHLAAILAHAFRLAVCDVQTHSGRTPLHEAAAANRVASHSAVLRCLSEWHHLDLSRRDRSGKTAQELLCVKRGRPRSPSGTSEREGLLEVYFIVHL
jgi:hypothetical protein